MVKNVLIAGDSFAARYPKDTGDGWPLLLRNLYDVVNVAQAGVSEYKILKQLKNITNIGYYDAVIVCHTSPYRVHTRTSIHNTELHKDCDLLVSDVEAKRFSLNPAIRSAQGYFKHHFDPDYYEDIYALLRKEISEVTRYVPTLHVDHFESSLKYANEKHKLDLSRLWPDFRGSINHYNVHGNQIVFENIVEKIEELK